MSEKLNYNNGVNEDLEKLYPNIDDKQTKEDLKSLEFLIKTENEGLTYNEIILLIDKYNEYIRPIVSDIDYEGISNDEVKNRINNLKGLSELDKYKINVIFFGYLLKD